MRNLTLTGQARDNALFQNMSNVTAWVDGIYNTGASMVATLAADVVTIKINQIRARFLSYTAAGALVTNLAISNYLFCDISNGKVLGEKSKLTAFAAVTFSGQRFLIGAADGYGCDIVADHQTDPLIIYRSGAGVITLTFVAWTYTDNNALGTAGMSTLCTLDLDGFYLTDMH